MGSPAHFAAASFAAAGQKHLGQNGHFISIQVELVERRVAEKRF